MMRIALVQPPQRDEDLYVPVALLALATYVKQGNIVPIIFDFNLLSYNRKLSPVFFKQAAKNIINSKPHVIGFSVLCSTLALSLLIAEECKKINPKIPIIFGGPEVSFDEVEVLRRFDQVDIIIRGEGEITLTELLNALASNFPLAGILGVSYRIGSRIQVNPDRSLIKNLDDLPFLDYSLLPLPKKYKRIQIEAGRGCPYQCTFCSTCKMWKRKFRVKSFQRISEEMLSAYKFFDLDESSDVAILHDHFLVSRKVIEPFLKNMNGRGMAWSCSSRLESLSPQFIRKMKKAGCRGVFLGIETGSPDMQRKIKKNLPLNKLPSILRAFYRNGIQVGLSLIIGFPGETTEQINQTLSLALMSKFYSFSPGERIGPFAFLKGSELYLKYKNRMKQARLMESNFSPLFTGSEREKSLIVKNRSLFPSFYFLPSENISIESLQKTCVIFSLLTEVFPLTTFLLLGQLSLTPLELVEKLLKSFEAEGKKWIIRQGKKVYFLYYLASLRRFVLGNSPQIVQEAFFHETLFYKSGYAKVSLPNKQSNLHLRCSPRRSKNVKIQMYNYDLIGAFSQVGENGKISPEKLNQKKSYLAYTPGEVGKAVSLNPLSFNLLKLCNGKRPIRQIITMCLDKKDRTKKAEKLILDTFRSLQKEGVITVSLHKC